MKLPEQMRITPRMILAVFVGAVAWTILVAAIDGPFLRWPIDRADAEAHYRRMIGMMETDDWRPLCALTSAGFKGTFVSSDPMYKRRIEFDRGDYCRRFESDNTLVPRPDEVALVSIRNGPERRMMTVEYVARWKYERAMIETTYIEAIARNPFGDVRMHHRWIFEHTTRYEPTAAR